MKTITLFLAILSCFMNAQQRIFPTHPSLENKIGTHFPIEHYKNQDGKNFRTNHLQDKLTFINFWSTSCEPCIEELPYLNKLKETFGEKVNFIAITHDSKEKVTRFLVKKNFNFQHITDSSQELQSYFTLVRNPMSFILDKSGNIEEITGSIDESKFNMLLEILNK